MSRTVQELNARILLGCPSPSPSPSISAPAPACLHLHHLPFSPRRSRPYPLTWLGEMKHMAIWRIGTRPARHCRRRRLESCCDGAANTGVAGGNGTVQCSTVLNCTVSRSITMWRGPRSAPGNIVALCKDWTNIWAPRTAISFLVTRAPSSNLGNDPQHPVLLVCPSPIMEETADKLQLCVYKYGFR